MVRMPLVAAGCFFRQPLPSLVVVWLSWMPLLGPNWTTKSRTVSPTQNADFPQIGWWTLRETIFKRRTFAGCRLVAVAVFDNQRPKSRPLRTESSALSDVIRTKCPVLQSIWKLVESLLRGRAKNPCELVEQRFRLPSYSSRLVFCHELKRF